MRSHVKWYFLSTDTENCARKKGISALATRDDYQSTLISCEFIMSLFMSLCRFFREKLPKKILNIFLNQHRWDLSWEDRGEIIHEKNLASFWWKRLLAVVEMLKDVKQRTYDHSLVWSVQRSHRRSIVCVWSFKSDYQCSLKTGSVLNTKIDFFEVSIPFEAKVKHSIAEVS